MTGIKGTGTTPAKYHHADRRPLHAEVIRDYAAALASAVKKWFLGPLYLRRIPRLILFTKPYLLFGGMITQSPGK